jgi:excinuclease ABC subunit C
LHREGDRGTVARVPVRGGMLLEPEVTAFEGEIGEDAELLSAFLNSRYEPGEVPPEILLPCAPADQAALQEVLSERRGGAVRLHVPQRGDKVRVMEIAEETARARYRTRNSEEDRRARALEGLVEIVGLPVPPRRIECYDNSNLLGEDPVASQVVFTEGRPDRAAYRRYKVRTVVGADDFATMAEILERRLLRAQTQEDMPDLIVVDGGRGQLHAALAVRDRLGLDHPPMIGLSKPRTERRRGDRDAVDKIVLPDEDEPVILPEHHPTLRLLQHLRDEAHATAVGFHRKQRSRSALQSQLEALPGVGKTRRVALLRHFGSLSRVREASVEELAAAPGIGPALAAKIHAGLRAAGEAASGEARGVAGPG